MNKPDRTIRDAVLAYVEEFRNRPRVGGAASIWEQRQLEGLESEASKIEAVAHFYFKARVACARIVLPDGKTPQARIVLRVGAVRRTVPQEHALQFLIKGVMGHCNSDIPLLAKRLESLWDPAEEAVRKAEVIAAVSAALANDEKTAPIRKRLEERKLKDREAYVDRIRAALKSGNLRWINEDDVVALFREACVSEVLTT